MLHEESCIVEAWSSGAGSRIAVPLNPSTLQRKKETGRKINSPPGLKFGVVTPKRNFEVVSISVGALVPFSLR
jgi:hypothetical protein